MTPAEMVRQRKSDRQCKRKVIPPPSANGPPSLADAPLLREHLTDTGNARRLVALFGERLRFCHPWQKWLVWDGRRWREDDTCEPVRFAKETARALLREATQRAAEVAQAEPDREKAQAALERYQAIAKFALQSESAGKLTAMVSLAASEPGLPILPAALNSHPWLLNCANGTIDLKTGQLCSHQQSDYITQLCPTPFDAAATCPVFARFLEDVFQSLDLIRFVQRLMGYSLTGCVTEQVLPIFYGTGANGKSTLLNAWLNVLGLDYAGKAPASLMVAHRGEHHPTELAALFGKRLMVATETESGARLAESQVKELTGGDRITARRMREDFWTFEPTHKLILATNHKPRVKGRDHAIWRRLRLIPFNRRFAPHEQDKALPEKLTNEAPGILAWIVCGCMDWQREGLGEPAEVNAATSEYRAAEDVLAAWMEECCDVTPDNQEKAAELFGSYEKWCDASGERASLTKRQLCAELREAGFEDYTNAGLWFRGIGLRPILPT